MSSVTRESLGTLHEKINLKLEKNDYYPGVETSLKKYAKSANIPGFRPGMVPMGVLKKMYGQAIMTDEIVKIAGKTLEEYLKKEQLSIFAEPMVLPNEHAQHWDIMAPADVDFFFEIGIKPTFDIPAITNKTPVTRYKVQLTDKLLDDEIMRIRRRDGEKVRHEMLTADCLTMHYLLAEKGIETPAETEDSQIATERLSAQLLDKVKTMKTGDTYDFKPADVCTEEELKPFMQYLIKAAEDKKDSVFTLTFKGGESVIPAEMNEELFKKVYPNDESIKDEAAFREKLRAEIGRDFIRAATNRLHNEIFELLVHNTPFELPVNFLKRWLKEGSEKKRTAEDVEKEFGSFEHSLRWQVISDKLIQENGIVATQEDIKNQIRQALFDQYGLQDMGDLPFINDYVNKMAQDKTQAENAYIEVLNRKIFELLETKLPIEEKEVDEDTFYKLPSAHEHHHHH